MSVSVSGRFLPLNEPKITGKRLVLYHPDFEIANGSIFGVPEQEDYKKLLRLLLSGGDISNYYRKDVDKGGDKLLSKHRIMHLHLNGKDSDSILYLIQYPEHVVLLCVDTHVHLDDIPPGKKFKNGFEKRAAAEVEAAIAAAEEQERQLAVQAAIQENEHQAKVLTGVEKLRASFRDRKQTS